MRALPLRSAATEDARLSISGTNFGAAAADYAQHRAGFPPSLFERLEAFDIGRAGQQLVDLGTGTGTLARSFAERGCQVTGIDPDNRMLTEARALAETAGLAVTFREGRAEQTGLEAGSAEVVCAGQCWHWFDRKQAIAECRRLLVPGGRLLPRRSPPPAAPATDATARRPDPRIPRACAARPATVAPRSAARRTRCPPAWHRGFF